MKKKVFSLLLAGMLTFSMGTTAYATEDAIADMQAQKQHGKKQKYQQLYWSLR